MHILAVSQRKTACSVSSSFGLPSLQCGRAHACAKSHRLSHTSRPLSPGRFNVVALTWSRNSRLTQVFDFQRTPGRFTSAPRLGLITVTVLSPIALNRRIGKAFFAGEPMPDNRHRRQQGTSMWSLVSKRGGDRSSLFVCDQSLDCSVPLETHCARVKESAKTAAY
jgi:hypothetical protein